MKPSIWGRSTITDVGTTYKLCRRSVVEQLLPLLRADLVNLEFNAYFLDVAMAHGYRVIECPDHLSCPGRRQQGRQHQQRPGSPGRPAHDRRNRFRMAGRVTGAANSAMSWLRSASGRAAVLRVAWLTFGTLGVLLTFFWAKFAYNAWLTAVFPGEIDYGEGIVWQQARLIPGPRMYGDLQTYPFLVFHYPPLYHLVVHALAGLGMPWLVAGRLVSTLSTVALAVFAAAFVHEAVPASSSRRGRMAGAALAGLLLVTLHPIQVWAYDMRVDMLAVALEFLGMYLGLRSLREPKLIYWAGLAFVAALFTKQTMIEGAVATLAALLVRTPGRALRAGAFAAVLGACVFALLTIVTRGGFPRHTIFYNINPFTLKAVYDGLAQSKVITTYPVYLLPRLGHRRDVCSRGLLKQKPRAMPAASVMALLYFLLTTCSLVSLGKEGSWINYLIPWVSSWVLLIGLATAEVAGTAERRGQPLMLLALFGVLFLQALATPKFGEKKVVDPAFRREYTQLIALVAKRAPKPVPVRGHGGADVQAGREVPWEPTIITDLSRKGVFDERKAIGRVEARDFSYVIREKYNFRGERFSSPAMEAAIAKAYPVQHMLAGLRVLSP